MIELKSKFKTLLATLPWKNQPRQVNKHFWLQIKTRMQLEKSQPLRSKSMKNFWKKPQKQNHNKSILKSLLIMDCWTIMHLKNNKKHSKPRQKIKKERCLQNFLEQIIVSKLRNKNLWILNQWLSFKSSERSLIPKFPRSKPSTMTYN